MNVEVKLGERAVLMKISIGLPGETRQDPRLSQEVKADHNLGTGAGKWLKNLFPPTALDKIKSHDNKARDTHNALTLPFDKGTGILPAGLIEHYAERMRDFKDRRSVLMAEFLDRGQDWVDWATVQHNGTFDPSLYPGCSEQPTGSHVIETDKGPRTIQDYTLDLEAWKAAMSEKFYFRTEPIPVPESTHFANTVASLLGTDTQSVDQRVRDAAVEAQREVMRRMIEPVKAMAEKLAEQPKGEKKDIIFRDTLVSNLQDIAKLAPKLNLGGDPEIDKFAREIGALTITSPDTLRDNKETRSKVQASAADLLKRLEGYKI